MANSILEYWFILIFAKPGNCKSLEQARLSEIVLDEYYETEKKYPLLPKRILFTNQKLNDSFDGEVKNGHLIYWENPEQFRYCPRKQCWRDSGLHLIHDVDLFIDEGATLFPSDRWADTPLWLRKLWAQHRHNGIRILMLTQDFKAIDINCRRMLWQAYYLKKIMGSRDISPTLPPLRKWTLRNFFNPFVSVVWGIYSKQRIDPQALEMDPLTMFGLKLSEQKQQNYEELELVGVRELHVISWHKINLYDTTQDVKEYEIERELEHIQVQCKKCSKIHLTHKLK